MTHRLAGKKFGLLTVERRVERPEGLVGKGAYWQCRCECGETCIVVSANLVRGHVVSCGHMRGTRIAMRPAEIRQRQNDRAKYRLRNDPRFALIRRTRDLLHAALKRGRPSPTWVETHGYTIAEAEARLRSTLPEGADWEHFLGGDLEIDHIVQMREFAFTKATDPGFKEAWALSNLRLLTKHDRQKRNRRT